MACNTSKINYAEFVLFTFSSCFTFSWWHCFRHIFFSTKSETVAEKIYDSSLVLAVVDHCSVKK